MSIYERLEAGAEGLISEPAGPNAGADLKPAKMALSEKSRMEEKARTEGTVVTGVAEMRSTLSLDVN